MAEELNKAWLAGFFDGEGSVGFTNANRTDTKWMNIRVSLTQKDELDLLNEVKAYYGGSVSPHSKRNGTYQWNLSAADGVAKFLEDVLPFIRLERKRERATIILAIAKLIRDNDFRCSFGKLMLKDPAAAEQRADLEDAFERLQ